MYLSLASARDPMGEMRGLLRRMDDIFRTYDRAPMGLSHSGGLPVVVRDTGDELVLRADVPGMSESDISIDATAQAITIRGEKKVDVPEGYAVLRQERGALRFARTIALPKRVDLEQIRASVKDGVLTIHAAKLPEERPKQITLQST